MPGQSIIDLGFDPAKLETEKVKVIASLNEVLAVAEKLDNFKISFNDFGKGLGAFKNDVTGVVTVQQQLIKTTDDYNKSLIIQAKAQEASAKAKSASAKATNDQIRAESEVIKQITLEEKAEQENLKTKKLKNQESERTTKLSGAEKKQADDLTNDYLQLSKAYNEAALKSKNYALRLGETHPVTLAAVKDAKSMYDILLRVDQAVGQNQRQVGNYKSAFDGLSFSFTQVARELPSLTVSTQQFFLAISNNLPMVFDEIKKAKVEIAALKAQGKDAPSLFERIGSSLISWQVGLSIGITLLTAYGAKIVSWVSDLISGKEALVEITQAQVDFNQALLDNSKRWDERKGLVKDAFDTELSLMQRQIDLLEASGASDEQIFAKKVEFAAKQKELALKGLGLQKEISEKELFNLKFAQNGRLTELGIITKKINDLQLKAADTLDEKRKENFQKEIKLEEIRYEFRLRDYNKTNDLLHAYFDAEKDLVDGKTKLHEKDSDIFKRTLDAQIDIQILYRQRSANLFKSIADDEKNNYEARKTALAAYFNEVQKINELQLKKELNKKDLLPIEKEKLQIEFGTKSIELAKRFSTELIQINDIESAALLKIWEDEANKKEEFEKGMFKAGIDLAKDETDILKNGLEGRLKEIETASLNEQTLLTAKYNAGKISYSKYQLGLAEIQKKAAKDALQVTIDLSQRQLDILSAAGLAGTKAWTDLKNAIAKAQNQLVAYSADIPKLGTNASKELKKILEFVGYINDATKQLSEVFLGAVDIGYTKQKNSLQEIEDEQDKNYEAEVTRITNSTLAEEDKANRLKILEAERTAQTLQNDRKERDLEVKRARFQKAANIANMITEGALAVIHQLASGDPYTAIGRAIAVGLISAAKIAVAIATPIPQYAFGIEDKPFSGPGIVGEGKHKELVQIPGQKPFIADHPMLLNLPIHSKVTPLTGDYLNEAMNLAMIKKTADALKIGSYVERNKDKANNKMIVDGLNMQTRQLLQGFSKNKPRIVNNIDIGEQLKFKKYIDKNVRGTA